MLYRELKYRAILLFLCLQAGVPLVFAQNVVNNGHHIVVASGAYFTIGGDYHNKSIGQDADVDLDGVMKVFGNWYNNASGTPGNNVFVNLEPTPNGTVILCGSDTQHISGNMPTHFENLHISGGRKMLDATNTEVNGIFTVNAIFDLNTKRLIIDNPSPLAINYINRYIFAETNYDQGYGEIQWNISNFTDQYQIPFGSGNAGKNDLNLMLTTKSEGVPDAGYIVFTTYPTDCFNDPYPGGVFMLDRDFNVIADRFWLISPDYTEKPNIDITFKYTDWDIVPDCNNELNANKLKGHRYNTSEQTWDDWDPKGISDRSSKIVTVTDIPAEDFFAPWCLVSQDQIVNFFIPNAFTPDGDGINDFFGPVGFNLENYDFTMYIYDRWGEVIYKTQNVDNPWDGTYKNGNPITQEGVFVWLVVFADKFGNVQSMDGTVTLLITAENQ